MIYRPYCIAILAATTLGVAFGARHASAQTKAISPLSAPAEVVPNAPLPDAQFGAVRVDQTRAAAFGDLISSETIERQIKEIDSPLFFRENSLGFYDVSFEATGDRGDGKVRVLVTIVGQSDGETILARGQGVQEWRDGRWLLPAPVSQTPNLPTTPDIYPPAPAAPQATSAGYLMPKLAFIAFCVNNNKRRQDDNSKAAKAERAREDAKRADEGKSDEKPKDKPAPRSAPDPAPKRETDTKAAAPPRSAPDPNPPSRGESSGDNASRGDDSKRRGKANSPSRPRVYVPTFPAPRPQSPDSPRASAPDPNPPVRDQDNRPVSAPDPNPPSSGTANIGPNPNPPSRGNIYNEPRRPRRRPVWDDPYGRYPYPVPYPYPYPVPYPVPNTPTPTPNSGEGARQAFDYALLQARAQAEADFAWQLRAEPLDER